MAIRDYTTRRQGIVEALVTLVKKIDGSGTHQSNLYENVIPRLKFWDEVSEFPFVCITAGLEEREYLPAGFKWRFLNITIRIYVKHEEANDELERIMEDIETILETNTALSYANNRGADSNIVDLRILSVDTDEGVLHPLAIGEMICQIRY